MAEIGLRCQDAQFLLRPSGRLNKLLVGVLARAQRRSGVGIIAPSVMSNHMHLLLWADDAKQLADFMEYAAGNAAREVSRLLFGHERRIWQTRYVNILVSEEPEAQIARLRYLLEQGCKEDLVSSPLQWPGIHAAKAILSARPLKGIWVDRAGLYNAGRKNGKKPRPIDFEHEEKLALSALPCWAHLPSEQYRQKVKGLVRDIEEETDRRHRTQGTRPAGRRAVLKKNPRHKPRRAKKRPAPLVHAATKAARQRIQEAYREFVKHFRAAADVLQEDKPTHGFPEGAFPSPLPFIRHGPAIAAG